MKKNVFLIMLPLLAMLFTLTSCENKANSQKVSELKRGIKELNSQLPQSLGMLGTMESASYDDKTNNMVLVAKVNDDFSSYDDFVNGNNNAKEMVSLMFAENPGKKFGELLVDAESGLRLEYSWPGGDKFTVELTPDDIRKAIDSPLSGEQKSDLVMTTLIDGTKSTLPMEIEEGLTITDVIDDGSNLVYLIDVDEDQYVIALMESNIDNVKLSMKLMIANDATMKQLARQLSSVNRGIVYRYVGNISGNTINVEITPSELKTASR